MASIREWLDEAEPRVTVGELLEIDDRIHGLNWKGRVVSTRPGGAVIIQPLTEPGVVGAGYRALEGRRMIVDDRGLRDHEMSDGATANRDDLGRSTAGEREASVLPAGGSGANRVMPSRSRTPECQHYTVPPPRQATAEPSWVPVTDPALDAPDGAVLTFPDGHRYERIRNEWCRLEECTGVTASWCPIHGDCTCPRNKDGDARHLDHPGCALHSPTSAHGEA